MKPTKIYLSDGSDFSLQVSSDHERILGINIEDGLGNSMLLCIDKDETELLSKVIELHSRALLDCD